MSDDDAWIGEIACEIRAYLRAHPDAADTLAGVVQCWIVHERFLRGIAAAQKAMDRLVAQGEVERIDTADGRTIFRAPRGSCTNGDITPTDRSG